MAKFRSWNNHKNKFFYWKDGICYNDEKCLNYKDFLVLNFNWQNAEQSTGLFDKNGKEVFENDIAKMHYFRLEGTCNGVVEEDREMIGIVGINELAKYLLVDNDKHYFVDYFEQPSEELEIIGNIHEGTQQ